MGVGSTSAVSHTAGDAADGSEDSHTGCEAAPCGSEAGAAASTSVDSARSINGSPETNAATPGNGTASAAADDAAVEDYSSAAWIAEALGNMRVGEDSEGSTAAAPGSNGNALRASHGGRSTAAAAMLRCSGGRSPSSGDDSDEVTSPLTQPQGKPHPDAFRPSQAILLPVQPQTQGHMRCEGCYE